MEHQSPTRDTKFIAVGNQKGGVGKTTNACHLAAALGEMGRLCLIWDLDINHGSTKHFGIPPETYWGSFELLAGEDDLDNIILTGEEEDIELPQNVHLIAAARNLEGLDGASLKALFPDNQCNTPFNRSDNLVGLIFLCSKLQSPHPLTGNYSTMYL